MKRTTALCTLLLTFAVAACHTEDYQPEGPEALDEPSESSDEDLAYLDDVAPDAEVLAEFAMTNGNIATLYSIPDEGELIFTESAADQDSLVFKDNQGVSIVERFLMLAPSNDIPVPQALIDADTTGQIPQDRATVDAIATPIDVDVVKLGLAPAVANLNVGNACADAGYFLTDVCHCPGCALITAFWFCDHNYNSGNDWWYSLTRSTLNPNWGDAKRKEDSWSKTVACGTPVRTRHYRKALVGNKWYKSIDETRPAGWYTIWHAEGWKRHRKVKHNRTTNSGGLRAHTYFY